MGIKIIKWTKKDKEIVKFIKEWLMEKKEEVKEVRIMGLYVVYDKLAEESGPVFEAKNDQVARRAYNQILGQNKVNSADEYALYKVGEIEKEEMRVTGKLDIVDMEYGKKEEVE